MQGALRRGTLGAVVFIALSVVVALPARAESDYDDKDFSLRLASAFVRFRDVLAGGGLTAANRWPSAINPASSAWSKLPGKYRVAPAAYESPIWFDEGTRLNVSGLAVTAQTRLGTFQPAASLIQSNDATTAQGLTFDYDVESAQLGWATRCRKFGYGASFNYSHATVKQDLGPFRVVDSDADSYRFRVGGLYEPKRCWLVGAIAEYGWADFEATSLLLSPAGAPVPVQLSGTDRQAIFQTGASRAYGEYSSFFVDYFYGRFWSDRGILNMHRFSVGLDHQSRNLEFLFLRPAITIDARGNFEFALGIGIQFAKWGGVEIAYKYDAFPELRPEFGRSDTLQVTLGLRF